MPSTLPPELVLALRLVRQGQGKPYNGWPPRHLIGDLRRLGMVFRERMGGDAKGRGGREAYWLTLQGRIELGEERDA